jgi:hypothetical protein
MTVRACFGDFVQAARRSLGRAAPPVSGARPRPAALAAEVHECVDGLRRAVHALDRYLHDIVSAQDDAAGRMHDGPDEWRHAAIQARAAVKSACQALPVPHQRVSAVSPPRMTSSTARDLRDAAVAMVTGRDLLQTHFASTPDGVRKPGSEWAPIIASEPLTNALLIEVASWARQIVVRTAYLAGPRAALPPPLAAEQRTVAAAWRSLSAMVAAVDSAQRGYPVQAAAVRQLYAVPTNVLQTRWAPTKADSVLELCQAVAATAERVRRAADLAAVRGALSSGATTESFSFAASSAAIVSHNCALLQRSLGTRAAQRGDAETSERLLAAVKASEIAQRAWMHAARGWHGIRTDATDDIAPAAAELAALAAWTGRLAYADPNWTASVGSACDLRPPHELAPGPQDLDHVLTAVQQATATLTTMAATDYVQIRSAAGSGRLLVAAKPRTASAGKARPFVRAPSDSVERLLTSYRDAGTASVQATAQLAEVADKPRGRRRRLVLARARKDPDRRPSRGPAAKEATSKVLVPGGPKREDQVKPEAATDPRPDDQMPGPVERILRELGVGNHDLLNRATILDDTTRQLVADAARETAPQRWHAAVTRLRASVDTAQIIDQVVGRPVQSGPAGRYELMPAAAPAVQRERELEAD